MTMKADQTEANAITQATATGKGKFGRDVLSIFQMKLFMGLQAWQWYLMGAIVFPMSLFFWSRALAPDDPEAVRRLMTGQ